MYSIITPSGCLLARIGYALSIDAAKGIIHKVDPEATLKSATYEEILDAIDEPSVPLIPTEDALYFIAGTGDNRVLYFVTTVTSIEEVREALKTERDAFITSIANVQPIHLNISSWFPLRGTVCEKFEPDESSKIN